jgi:hypothetical protein
MRARGLACALIVASCTPRGNRAGAGQGPSDAGSRAEAEASATFDSAADTAAESGPGPAIDALPPSQSDELTTRARHLLEAIAKDDPSLATDIVFPRDAYVTAKDAADPGKQWDDKVATAFQKQVHLLHKRTTGVERAMFTSFEMGVPISQVVPKKHDTRVALWKVRHCRLNFTIDGKLARIDVAELMSWRGAWYVLEVR